MSARTLAVIAIALAVLPVVLDVLFSLSGRSGLWGPLTLALLPFVATCAALASLMLPGSKWLSWVALALGIAGCAVVLWFNQLKPGDWR